MTFDFVDHRLVVVSARTAQSESIRARAETVADFHAAVMQSLGRLGVDVRIWTTPVEVPDPGAVRGPTSSTREYDRGSGRTHSGARSFRCNRCLSSFAVVSSASAARPFLLGKLRSRRDAVLRPPRAAAPEHADPITREAYSHEVISHGFWPGGGGVDEPAFYAYAAPEPEGLAGAAVRPPAAYLQHGAFRIHPALRGRARSIVARHRADGVSRKHVRCGGRSRRVESRRAGATLTRTGRLQPAG